MLCMITVLFTTLCEMIMPKQLLLLLTLADRFVAQADLCRIHSCTGAADFDFADGGARVRCGTCGGAPGAAVTPLLNRNKCITDRNCSNLTVTSVSLMRIRTPATDDLQHRNGSAGGAW